MACETEKLEGGRRGEGRSRDMRYGGGGGIDWLMKTVVNLVSLEIAAGLATLREVGFEWRVKQQSSRSEIS